MITIREYLEPSDRSSFARWFESLNGAAAAKVTTAVIHVEQG
jgi:hypothetical protein